MESIMLCDSDTPGVVVLSGVGWVWNVDTRNTRPQEAVEQAKRIGVLVRKSFHMKANKSWRDAREGV